MDDAPSTVPPELGAGKAAWRRWARDRRRALFDADPERRVDAAVAAHLRAWESWRSARWALVYVAFGSEVDPLAAGRACAGAAGDGPRLATTRTPSGGAPLVVHALEPETLERHPFGFLQPRADAARVALDDLDVALVPGLCFDRSGARLGHGRGYYDRLLPRLPAHVVSVGVTREALLVERVPVEPHDVAVAFVLTEGGLRRVDR